MKNPTGTLSSQWGFLDHFLTFFLVVIKRSCDKERKCKRETDLENLENDLRTEDLEDILDDRKRLELDV